jgi:hypothetical protein
MTQVGSRMMCLDPDRVPPLAGFCLYADQGDSTMSSLCLRYAFLKLLTVFDLLITPGTMFQASTTLLEKKFLLVTNLAELRQK